MGEMTAFEYGGFYDVPRYINLRYRGVRFLLQSEFDDDLDEYPAEYSVYLVPESNNASLETGPPELLVNTSMRCVGQIPVNEVIFDPSKRKELDASILDRFIDNARQ